VYTLGLLVCLWGSMAEPTRVSVPIRFGPFEISPDSGELRKNGTRLKLTGQAIQVLVTLLERPGQIVTREELQQELWPGASFGDFEHGINAVIKRLRDVLGDSAAQPKFIETIPRRGYRFIGPVQLGGAIITQTTPSQASKSSGINFPEKRVSRVVVWCSHRTKLVLAASVFTTLLAVGLFYRPLTAEHSGSLRERRLTFNSSDNHILASAISPDGASLAYFDPTGLYIRTIDSGEIRRVSLKRELQTRLWGLVWGPAGRELFATMRGLLVSDAPSVWIIPLLGQGQPRKLLEPGAHPAISPDGKLIAFVTQLFPPAPEVWLSNATGEGARPFMVSATSMFSAPAWSPDGRWIVYEKTDRHFINTSIEVRSVDGGTSATVLSKPPLPNMALLPHSDHPLNFSRNWELFFVGIEAPEFLSGRASLWRIRINPRKLGDIQPRRLAEWSDLDFASISSSLDGRRLAVLKRQYQSGVYLGHLGGRSSNLSSVRRFTADGRVTLPTSWTADSHQLLFASLQTGTPKIFSQSIDNTVAERITSGSSSELGPLMAPNHASILYSEYSGPETDPVSSKLMSVPLGGGQPKVLLETKGAFGLRCPNIMEALCIISQVESGNQVFYSVDLVHGTLRRRASCKQEDALQWDLSPDGLYLVALGHNNDLSVLNLGSPDRGWRKVKVKNMPSAIVSVSWASGGKGLIIATYPPDESTGGSLLHLGSNGELLLLWRDPVPEILISPTPSPDGEYLAFEVEAWDGNVWLLEGF
jgi:DNA-binding winged helix-turn-helix (wHTH) protein/Tol biopolymer transport system component